MIGPHRCQWRPCRAKLAQHRDLWPVPGGGFACSSKCRDREAERRRNCPLRVRAAGPILILRQHAAPRGTDPRLRIPR